MTKPHPSHGQAIVEFALVAPVFFFLMVGIVSFGWLFFQDAAVTNGARAGAREAIVETAWSGPGSTCESGQPESIQAAVQHGANIVPVAGQQLCVSSTDPSELVQTSPTPGAAVVTVTCSVPFSLVTSTTSAITYTVTVTYKAHPLGPFVPGLAIPLSFSATLPAQPKPEF